MEAFAHGPLSSHPTGTGTVMDDQRADPGAPGLPPDFVPLRLVLQATGSAVELTRVDMVLGRHSEADVRLPLPDVSRRHCQVVFRQGAWHVRDLKSLNGTFLNDVPVQEAMVCHGDTLRVGGFIFSVELGSARSPHKDEVVLALTPILPTISPDSDQARRAS
jgi:pSer/pThr/pTyr-binding forkhead associated (FHA) protein